MTYGLTRNLVGHNVIDVNLHGLYWAVTGSRCRLVEFPWVTRDAAGRTAAGSGEHLVRAGRWRNWLVRRTRGAVDPRRSMVPKPDGYRRSALVRWRGRIGAGWHQREELSDQRRALLSGQSCGNLSGDMRPFCPGSDPARR